jgi:hypothetical protein
MAYEVISGDERERFRTEREAVIAFCEYLFDDAILQRPGHLEGTKFAVLHVTTGKRKTLVRYVIGYR